MEIHLIIFDADGTLIARDSGQLLPGVAEYSSLLNHPGCRNRPALAVATNQGGPACRDAGWGDHYPALAQVESRYGALAAQLGARLYMSLIYIDKSGGIYIPAGLPADDPRLSLSWRKPQPGMLRQAMLDAGALPQNTLFIGDSPDDQAAARAAGCAFIFAQKFFARGWTPGQDWDLH